MRISHDDRSDLLYIRLDARKQEVMNRLGSGEVVLDIGEGDKIDGIEILDPSRHVSLDKLLPVEYGAARQAAQHS